MNPTLRYFSQQGRMSEPGNVCFAFRKSAHLHFGPGETCAGSHRACLLGGTLWT